MKDPLSQQIQGYERGTKDRILDLEQCIFHLSLI